MAKKRESVQERQYILTRPDKRPYGARVQLHVQDEDALAIHRGVSIPLSTGAFITIVPTAKAPWEGGQKFEATLEGFPTAAASEAAGRRFVQALLWTSISFKTPVRLEYSSYEVARVFERDRSAGASLVAYGSVSRAPKQLIRELHDAFGELPEPNEKLLLSMEIFCSAPLESSQRATFLLLVSALEPLAQEQHLGSAVANFLKQACASLDQDAQIATGLKASLRGRLMQLQSESIRQALRRLVSSELPERPEAADLIDDAYTLRSQLIHSGVPADLDTDLQEESDVVQDLIRSLYVKRMKRPLQRS